MTGTGRLDGCADYTLSDQTQPAELLRGTGRADHHDRAHLRGPLTAHHTSFRLLDEARSRNDHR